MKIMMLAAASSLMLVSCGVADTGAPVLSTPMPPATPDSVDAPAIVVNSIDKLEKAERVYVEIQKLAVAGLEAGWITGENAQRVRVINQRATAAFKVAKAAVDVGDLALQVRQAETILSLAQQMLTLAAP